MSLALGGLWAVRSTAGSVQPQPASDAASTEPTTSATPSATAIEVPELQGLTLTEARLVASAAGLKLAVQVEGKPVRVASHQTIRAQLPARGAVARLNSVVSVTIPPLAVPKTRPPRSAGTTTVDGGMVVVIDPGHQARSNGDLEAIGPGSTELKPKVTGGATGTVTRIPEHVIALEVARLVAARLEARGVRVVLTRTTSDVDLSNRARAKIANDAKAALFLRIHANSSTDAQVSGVSTLYPGSGRWSRSTSRPSRVAAEQIQRAILSRTNAVDKGVVARSDLSGFNWSRVPAVLVEAGFLSNRVEDRLLGSPAYQAKLADGIAEGVMGYLEGTQ